MMNHILRRLIKKWDLGNQYVPSIVKPNQSTQSTPTPSPITEQILGITVIVPTDSTIASPTSTLLNQLVFLKYKNEQKKIYYHFRSTRICI